MVKSFTIDRSRFTYLLTLHFSKHNSVRHRLECRGNIFPLHALQVDSLRRQALITGVPIQIEPIGLILLVTGGRGGWIPNSVDPLHANQGRQATGHRRRADCQQTGRHTVQQERRESIRGLEFAKFEIILRSSHSPWLSKTAIVGRHLYRLAAEKRYDTIRFTWTRKLSIQLNLAHVATKKYKKEETKANKRQCPFNSGQVKTMNL